MVCLISKLLCAVFKVNSLSLFLILFCKFLCILNSLFNVFLAHVGGSRNADMLLFARAEILCGNMNNAVCVNIKGYFDLRHTAACGHNAVKVEHTESFVIFGKLSFTLKNMNLNGGLIICRRGENLRFLCGNGGVSFNDNGVYAAHCFNTERKGSNIKKKQSFLCVGLDTDIKKIPQHLLSEEDPIFAFNKAIIDATADYCVAYKPNLAFYESLGVKGMLSFEKTVAYLRENYPDQFIIADAKRGDIGNTSEMYARSFFDHIKVDAVTVAPYMGEDSVKPFLIYQEAWVILLALTSNKGSHDFQLTEDANGERLFEKVLKKSQDWATDEQMMYVVGATQGKMFLDIRKHAPNHFLLVPGVGAQGGSLAEVAQYGMNDQCGLLVNSSRAIIYTDKTENFANAAREAAQAVQREMAGYLHDKGIIPCKA